VLAATATAVLWFHSGQKAAASVLTQVVKSWAQMQANICPATAYNKGSPSGDVLLRPLKTCHGERFTSIHSKQHVDEPRQQVFLLLGMAAIGWCTHSCRKSKDSEKPNNSCRWILPTAI
jgi:hypothetical protein